MKVTLGNASDNKNTELERNDLVHKAQYFG